MAPGSVIVDMAGDSGGNCELTKPGETIVEHDVTIISPLNLPSQMPESSSMMYARNVQALVDLMVDDEGNLALDWSDEVIAKSCVAGKQEAPATEEAPA
jgi:NAD(P) transhydrogenase subunit alpha